jgi:hypothetical protein
MLTNGEHARHFEVVQTRRCLTCGALVDVVAGYEFRGDERPARTHYEAVCDELVRQLADEDGDTTLDLYRVWAQRLVEMMEANE